MRANLAEDAKSKLEEDQILSQLTTLMVAGHETTAATVTWALYELTQHPEFQNQVRKEIKATRAQAVLRGDRELTISDLDSMKYLLALMKARPRSASIQIAFTFPCTGDASISPHLADH